MRESKYITMIDPFQERYGKHMGAVLFIPSLIGDLLYNAAVLLALGSTVSVVLGAGLVPSTIASVAIVVVYTLFGGLRSVAYTDLVQLPCIMIGLVSTTVCDAKFKTLSVVNKGVFQGGTDRPPPPLPPYPPTHTPPTLPFR